MYHDIVHLIFLCLQLPSNQSLVAGKGMGVDDHKIASERGS